MPDEGDPDDASVGTPIATTVIERYFARPSHGSGMVFDGAVTIEGEVDLVRLSQAWHLVVPLQPRLFAKLSGRFKQEERWDLRRFDQSDFVVDVLVGSEYDRDALIAAIDPRRGISGRLVVHREAENSNISRLHFLFHHSAIDGVGAIRIVTSVLRQYQSKMPDKPTKRLISEAASADVSTVPSPAVSETDSLTKSESTSGRPSFSIPNPRNAWVTLRGHNAKLDRHVGQTAPALVEEAGSHLVVQEHGPFVRTRLDRRVSRKVRDYLRDENVKLNDFAVAVTLQALSQFVVPAQRRYLCVMNPVQTRTWKQRRATDNHIGFAFLRRRHDELETLSHTIDSVQQQMDYVREAGVSGELADGMRILESVPWGFSVVERLGWFLPTASVTCLPNLKFGKRLGLESKATNFGPQDPENAHFIGNATLKDVEFLAPMQSNGRLAITIWETSDGISGAWRHVGTTPAAEQCRRLASVWMSLVQKQVS